MLKPLHKKIFLAFFVFIVVGIIIIYLSSLQDADKNSDKVVTPGIRNLSNQTILEGQNFKALDLKEYISPKDIDQENIKWIINGNKFINYRLSETFRLEFITPGENWFGIDTFNVSLLFNNKVADNRKLILSVKPVNDAPLIKSIPDQIVDEGESFSEINLSEYCKDIDNDLTQIKWRISGSKNIKAELQNNKLNAFPLNKDWYGFEAITITAIDPGNLRCTKKINFNIQPINDPPLIADVPAQTINEGDSFSDIYLGDYINDIDNDNSEIKCEIISTKFLKAYLSSNKLHVDVPDSNWFGSDTLSVAAYDPANSKSETKIIYNVIPVNDPPIIFHIPDVAIAEGEYSTIINLLDYASDIDNPKSELIWQTNNTSNLNIHIEEDKAFISLKNPQWLGTDTISLLVSDKESHSESIHTFVTVNGPIRIENNPFIQLRKVVNIAAMDGVNFLTSLARWDSIDVMNTAAISALTILLIASDESIQKEIYGNNSKSINTLADAGKIYGETWFTEIASGSIELYGLIANDKKAMQLGLEVYESYFIANNLHKFFKYLFGRSRPNIGAGAYKFEMFPSRKVHINSLPSGHATLAFSLSTVLSSVTDDMYLKALIYAPAVLTAFSRIHQNYHWASDVFMGSAIGYFVGDFLISRHRKLNNSNLKFGLDNQGRMGLKYYF